MIKVQVWFADAQEPTEWYEAVIEFNMQEHVECQACYRHPKQALLVEDGLVTLCLPCLNEGLDVDEVRLEDRTDGKAPEDDLPYRDKIIEQAQELGRRHGRAAGSWMFNGNTDQDEYAKVLKGHDDGDPEIMDRYRPPLSGEYADDYTPAKLLDELEVGVIKSSDDAADFDDILDAYQEAHSDAFWKEVIDICNNQLGCYAKDNA